MAFRMLVFCVVDCGTDPSGLGGGGKLWATMSGPSVAAKVRFQGLVVTVCMASPSVSVALVAVITRSSSTDWAAWRRRSRAASRYTSRTRPISALQAGQRAEAARAAAGQPGLVHERPVAHGDQPVGGG